MKAIVEVDIPDRDEDCGEDHCDFEDCEDEDGDDRFCILFQERLPGTVGCCKQCHDLRSKILNLKEI